MTAPPPSAEPVCARCPRVQGRSCCQPGEGESLATLTLLDVERIRASTGLSVRRFVEEEWWSQEDAHAYERARPSFRGYFRSHTKRSTLQIREGACVFHRPETGCALPAGARPLTCRLYPFERLADGSWTLLVDRQSGAPSCLAVDSSDTFAEVLSAFGLTYTTLDIWADELAAASLAHGFGDSDGAR